MYLLLALFFLPGCLAYYNCTGAGNATLCLENHCAWCYHLGYCVDYVCGESAADRCQETGFNYSGEELPCQIVKGWEVAIIFLGGFMICLIIGGLVAYFGLGKIGREYEVL